MSNNTRPEHCLSPCLGPPQVMPPVAQPEPEVLSKTFQPKSEAADALAAVDPASIPLPPSEDYQHLFDEWIHFPEDNTPQPEVSTLASDDPSCSSIANHDDKARVHHETIPDNTSISPPIGTEEFNVDGFPSLGIPRDPYLEKFLDGSVTAEEWLEHLRSQETLGTSSVAPHDSAQPQHEQDNTSVGTGIPSDLAQESSIAPPQQPPFAPDSQLTAISAHISTKASSAATAPTTTPAAPVVVYPQPTTTTYTQPSAIEMSSSSTFPSANNSAENPGTSIVNFNAGSVNVNTLNMSYYQTPNYLAHPPQQPQSGVHLRTHSPAPATPNQPAQHHPPAQARASTPSRGVTPKPQALAQARKKKSIIPNSSFKPTPLKQSWTSDDLAAKEEHTTAPVSGPSSQVNASAQSSAPAQPGPQAGSGPQVPARSRSRAAGKAPSIHTAVITPSRFRMEAAARSGTPGPVGAYTPTQPQASAQTNLKSTLHHNSLNKASPVQRAHSYPELQVNTGARSTTPALLASSTQSHSSTLTPTQSYTQVQQGHQAAPLQLLQETQSRAPSQTLLLTQPSGFNQPVSPAQLRSPSVAPALSHSQVRPPEYSNFHTGSMPLTPRPSPTEAFPLVQPQATAGPYTYPQAQEFTQTQSYTEEPAAHDTELSVERVELQSPVREIWLVKGDDEGEWYHVEIGDGMPFRVYPVPPPVEPPVSLPIGPLSHSNPSSRPATPVLVHQYTIVETAPEETYETPQDAYDHTEPLQPENSEHQANFQEPMHHPPSWPVQRSYSAPSLPIQAPGTLFTVTPPPSIGFMPQSGTDTFSSLYWQKPLPLDSPIYSPNFGAPATATTTATATATTSAPAQGYSAYSHAPTPGPSNQAAAPGPYISAHVNIPAQDQVATPSPNQSSSSLSSLSRSTSSWTPGPPAPAPKNKGKKRRAAVEVNDDEVQEIPAYEYQASTSSKGKRAKHGRA